MKLIEESQYSFDDEYPHFEGVWDSFKKIHNLSVPDAVMAPSPELIRYQMRRRRQAAIAKKIRAERLKKSNEDDTVLMNEGENGGNGGGDGGPGRPKPKDQSPS